MAREPNRNEAIVRIQRPNRAVVRLYVPVGRDYDELLTRCNAEFSTPNWIDGPKPVPVEKPKEKRR